MTAHRTLLYWKNDGSPTHAIYGNLPDSDLVELDDEKSLVNGRGTASLQYLPVYYGRYAFVVGDRNYSPQANGDDSDRPISDNPGPWEAFTAISLAALRQRPPLAQPNQDAEVARFQEQVTELIGQGKPVKLHVVCAHTLTS